MTLLPITLYFLPMEMPMAIVLYCPYTSEIVLGAISWLSSRLVLVLWFAVCLLYIGFIFLTSMNITPVMQASLFLLQICILYEIGRRYEEESSRGEEIIREKKEQKKNTLNLIAFPIMTYNKQKGVTHMNSTFLNLLKETECSNFPQFSSICKLSKTEITLEEDIRTQIDYFNSPEKLLNNITHIKVDFQVIKPNTQTFMELEIKYCKKRSIGKDNILLIIQENEKEIKEKENKIVRRYKNVISRTICHDLKSPLNGIITPLENIPQKYEKDLPIKMMKMCTKLLEYKIEDMIDYSQIELNQFIENYISFNIRATLNEVKIICKTQAGLANLKIKINVERGIPDVIMADQKRIIQILLHLTQNAIKYTRNGLIIIYTKRRSGNYEFGVKDPGTGMNPKVQIHLKKLLTKGIGSPLPEKGVKDEKEETEMGFGLWITEKICEGIGSKLDFVSSLSSGSKFYFRIVDRTKSTSFCRYEINILNDSPIILPRAPPQIATRAESMHLTRSSDDVILQEIEDISYKDSIILRRKQQQLKPLRLSKFGTENLKLKVPKDRDVEVVYKRMKSENITHGESKEYRKATSPHSALSKYQTPERKEVYFGTTPRKQNSANTMTNQRNIFFQPTSYRALVVDDMPVNRLVLKMLLEGLKVSTDEANNGKVAVEMCQRKIAEDNLRKPYDIIFMDIEMPVMNGFIATKNLLTIFQSHFWGKTIPIIAVTAYDTEQIKAKAFKSGMNEFTPKPVKTALLEYYCRKYLPNYH